MPLYQQSDGKLVITASAPSGATLVSPPATMDVATLSSFYRNLDSTNPADFHPMKYIGGLAELVSTGSDGYSNALASAYKRVSTEPTDNPGDVTWDFTTASISSSLANGWSKTIPPGSGPVFAIFAGAASQATSVLIPASAWEGLVLLFQDGSTGETSFTSYVFKRSVGLPATPVGGSYVSPLPVDIGWSDGIPTDNGLPVWMTKRVFTLSGAAPQDATWGTPAKIGTPSTSAKLQFSVDGTSGWHDVPAPGDEWMRSGTSIDNGISWSYAGSVRIKGEAGSSGTATRGPSHWYLGGYTYWSDSVANTAIATAGYTPMEGDQVTISGTNFSHVKKYSSSAWVDLGQVIHGDLVVTNSINASKLNTNGIEVRDNFGNVLFSAGVPLDYAHVGGLKPPSDATKGASSINFTGGTSANLLSNSSFSNSLAGWTYYLNAGMSLNAFSRVLPGNAGAIGTLGGVLYSLLGPVQDYSSSLYAGAMRVPCKAGDRFELQAMVQVWRGRAVLQISYFNAAGDWVSGQNVSGGVALTNYDNQTDIGLTFSNNLVDWTQLWGFATVPSTPSGIVACSIEIRVARTQTVASTDVYVGMTYLGRAYAGQTEKSNWVDGAPKSTSQFLDDAALGQTALWGALSGRPADAELLNSYQNWLNLAGKPTLGAWATFLGKLSASNLLTYMETAAITNAFIDSLDAAKITTGFLQAGRIDANTVYMDTLNVAGGAITANDSYENGNYVEFNIPANSDEASGNFMSMGSLALSVVPHTGVGAGGIYRIVTLSFSLHNYDSTPGRLLIYLSKGGVVQQNRYIDVSTRLLGTAPASSIQFYSLTFRVATAADENTSIDFKIRTENQIGASQRWTLVTYLGDNYYPAFTDVTIISSTGKR